MDNPNIEQIAARFLEAAAALNTMEPLIKGIRAAAREELASELAPYLARQTALQAERAELVDVLLPEWIAMYESSKVKRFAGIELRRGKVFKALLPEDGSEAYRAVAQALLEAGAYVGGEPVVEFKINKRLLDKWIDFHGRGTAAELGLEVAASDTLAVARDNE